MKRLMTLVALLALTVTGSAAGGTLLDYKWTVSSSSTDPGVNTGPAAAGFVDLYLWLTCAVTGGAASADFGIEVTGDWSYSSFTPAAGVLNFGSGADLVLGLGGCPAPDFMAGTIALIDFTGGGGTVCIFDSGTTGQNVTVDCDPIVPVTHPNAVQGFATTPNTPCVVADCTETAVDPATWSGVKALYR